MIIHVTAFMQCLRYMCLCNIVFFQIRSYILIKGIKLSLKLNFLMKKDKASKLCPFFDSKLYFEDNFVSLPPF